jgi:hypothetical protein
MADSLVSFRAAGKGSFLFRFILDIVAFRNLCFLTSIEEGNTGGPVEDDMHIQKGYVYGLRVLVFELSERWYTLLSSCFSNWLPWHAFRIPCIFLSACCWC